MALESPDKLSITPDRFDVIVAKNVVVPMRDGVRLRADVYRPARNCEPVQGCWPTILHRTIYDKSKENLVGQAEYFCSYGYAVVVQDCRGRFQSEGEYYHFINEADDGYDTVEWIAGQTWSDGKVGTYGVSYSSQVQSALAVRNPPHLAAMIPMEGPTNIYRYGLRHDGAFQLKFLTVGFWLGQSSHEARANPTIKKALENARMSDWMLRLPLKPGQSPLALIPTYEQFVHEFITRGDYDEFWEHPAFNIEAHLHEHADVPTYIVTGWYDSWPRTMLDYYVQLSEQKRSSIKILVGPWIHGDDTVSATHAGEVDFGPAATLDRNLAESHNAWRRHWFDRWLKQLDNGADDEPPIKIFVMGGGSGRKNAEGRLEHGGRWRDEYEWPLARTTFTDFYLHADGSLQRARPPDDGGSTSYRYDPDDPVPTISGSLSGLAEIVPMPPGVGGEPPPMTRLRNLAIPGAAHQVERPDGFACKPPYLPLSARHDVLVFQTPPLEEAVEVTGPILVHLWASSSALDTDFTAKLLDVYPASPDYPDGFHMNITEGIIRARYRELNGKSSLLEPGRAYEFTVTLEPTSNLFVRGHGIRLDISSSNFPRFDINPNTGEPVGQHTHSVVAINTVFHEAARASRVTLPIISADETPR
jgi:putative CocE/NonD family hydrolase